MAPNVLQAAPDAHVDLTRPTVERKVTTSDLARAGDANLSLDTLTSARNSGGALPFDKATQRSAGCRSVDSEVSIRADGELTRWSC